jgi:hypothetical protein
VIDFVEIKRFDEALKALPQVSETSHQDWISVHIRAMALLKNGNLDEAVKLLEMGVQKCEAVKSRNYFASALSLARIKQKKPKEARDAIEKLDNRLALPAASLLQAHVYGLVEDSELAAESLKTLPQKMPTVQEQLREELTHRFVNMQPANESDDWLFDRQIESLLLAA